MASTLASHVEHQGSILVGSRSVTKPWCECRMVEALISASKVTRVHSGLGLRLPMLQRKDRKDRGRKDRGRKDRGRNAKEKGIGTSTTSLLGSNTYSTYLLYFISI